MLRNKKGFTLVELLAVIVILAIILAIAVPTISSLLTAQKKNAFEAGVKMIIKGVDYYVIQNPTYSKSAATTEAPTLFGGSTADYGATLTAITAGTGVTTAVTITGAAGGKFAGCNTGTVKGTPASVTFTTVSVAC